MDPGLVAPKWPEGRCSCYLRCSLRRSRGTEDSEPILLDESCDSSAFSGNIQVLRLIWPEVVESPLVCRAVSGSPCSTVAEGALSTSVSVREGKRGSADPVDAFESGAPVGGNKFSTAGEGFLPVGLLGKGDEVTNLVSSLTGNRVERPPPLRGNAESSYTLDSGASVSTFPAPQTDRHRMAGRRSRTPSLKGATTARRVAGGRCLVNGPRCREPGVVVSSIAVFFQCTVNWRKTHRYTFVWQFWISISYFCQKEVHRDSKRYIGIPLLVLWCPQ